MNARVPALVAAASLSVAVAGAAASSGDVFRVPFEITDGCHACARIGTLTLDFDFDPSGRLVGSRVASVRADGR